MITPGRRLRSIGRTIHAHRMTTDTTQHGFTLLEILIALGLAAVIAAALYSSFSLAHSAVETVDNRLLKLQEARFLLDVMRREIEAGFCTREKTYSAFKVEDRDYYGRQASRLSLTTLTSLLPDVVRIDYSVTERNGRLSLQKRITRASGKSGESGGETLVDDIESFGVEVLHNGKWIKTWDCALSGMMPEQVRVSVGFPAEPGKGGDKERPLTFSDYAFPRVGSSL